MKIGYARVSTGEQNPDLQLDALKAAGCERVFIDKASGADFKRAELAKCLKALGEGDTLTVWKLDRLGRTVHKLIELLDGLKGRGVAFQSLTESIDTATPTGRAMWQMVGILAELERSLISERTKAGREAAKARGVKMGRKVKLSPEQIVHAHKLLETGEHINDVAKSLSVSRRTLYRVLSN
ncbi:Site-specific DNA recombinase [Methylomagnum ishizawai]|uniref:Site-specific DNA recombinase n=1 Tax=Methylomagnum ishizawai TaxID=1760988 RepID=A0A1Y6D4M2_9GAMM|nr:recombinase family protein [Methylomagnum ishizawai]SMF97909.1 Site-specific DNA recombinase [Methylomagnum ishizawai]